MNFDYQRMLTARPERLTREKWQELTLSEEVNRAVYDYQHGDSAAKRRLPAVMWQASFGGGKRSNANARPSGLYMLDLDHLEGNTAQISAERIVPHIRQCGIMLIHTTPSGHGLRIVARMLRANASLRTISEHQQWLARELGFASEVDTCTKDMARMSFVVPENYVHYIDLTIFTAEPEMTVAPEAAGAAPSARPHAATDAGMPADAASAPADAAASQNLQTHYMGIPLKEIAQRLIENMFDVEIAEGNRNSSLYKLGRTFRYVCDSRPEVMAAAMPSYGLPREEVLAICRSACDGFRRTNPPAELETTLRELRAEQNADVEDEEHTDLTRSVSLSLKDYQQNLPPLPPLFREYVHTCPQDFKAVEIVSMLPVVGTLCTAVRATYLDGCEQSPSFLTVVTAPQASGKSFARTMYNSLTQRLQAEDATNRAIEEAYRQELKRAKNAKEQPQDPRAIIRLLPPSVSIAKLLQRLDYAQQRHLLTFAEEIDTLTKSNRSGAWAQKSDIYRNAFDNAEYGQDYMSDASYSTVVRVYYNLLVLGTPRAVGRFFNDVEDGLVSRVIFAELPSQAGKRMPRFLHFTPTIAARCDRTVSALMAMNAQFDLGFLNRALEAWLEQRREDFLRTQNMALEIFRRRAAVVGFRAGLVAQACYMADMSKDSKLNRHRNRIKAFALWVADYTLTALLSRFGDKMDEVQGSESAASGVNYVDIFTQLPDRFSTDELRALAKKYNVRTAVKMIVYRWKSNDLITKVEGGSGTYEKINKNEQKTDKNDKTENV